MYYSGTVKIDIEGNSISPYFGRVASDGCPKALLCECWCLMTAVLCVTCRVASLRALGVALHLVAPVLAHSDGGLRRNDRFTTLKLLISWNG